MVCTVYAEQGLDNLNQSTTLISNTLGRGFTPSNASAAASSVGAVGVVAGGAVAAGAVVVVGVAAATTDSRMIGEGM